MRHSRLLRGLLAVSALIGLAPAPAGAGARYTGEQIAAATPRAGANGVADLDARQDVLLAELPSGGSAWPPLSRLERVEVAVLDHRSNEIGRAPPTGLPSARTSAISELDQARVDVLLRDAARARQTAAASRPALAAARHRL